ncbi:MAG TPA: tetratricopeptide repeat protein, partial [Firmicutes bacterium]|nr:tetratricopeptide repeat protein [Bacillota bacterium]
MRSFLAVLILLFCAFVSEARTPVEFYYENPAKAMHKYEKLIEKDGSNKRLLYDAASVYKEFGENRKAFEAYRRIIALNENEVRGRFESGKMYYFLGALNYAEEEMKHLERMGEVNWEVYYWWGVILFEMKRYAEAEEKLKESIRRDEHKVIAYLKLAELYEEKGSYDAALEYYGFVLRKDRTYTEINRRIARIYEKKKDYMQAYSYWEKTGDVFPRDKIAAQKQEQFARLVPEVRAKIDAEEEEKQQRRYSYVPPETTPVSDAEQIPIIRIGLKRGEERIYFKCGSGFTVYNRNDKVIMRGEKLKEYVIETEGSRGVLKGGDKEYHFRNLIEIKKDDEKATTAFYDIN